MICKRCNHERPYVPEDGLCDYCDGCAAGMTYAGECLREWLESWDLRVLYPRLVESLERIIDQLEKGETK